VKRSDDDRAAHSATVEIFPSETSSTVNSILYVLVGGCVAVVIVLRFLEKEAAGRIRIDEINLAVAALFIAALAGSAFVLKNTRWGRRLRWRANRKLIDQDVQVWTDARTKGHVRKPPTGPIA
jgi:hypothetical protein